MGHRPSRPPAPVAGTRLPPAAPTVGDVLRQAAAALARNDFPRAETLYRAILAAQPRQTDALAGLGGLCHRLGRHREAAESFTRALEQKPGAPDLLANLGVVLLALGRADESLARCDQALARLPDHPAIHCNRGNALRALGRHEDALAAYDRAIALDARHAEAHDNRGVVLEALRRYDDALAAHDRALALHPGFARAWHNRGVALIGLRRHAEAAESLRRALTLQPAFPEALNHLAVALTRQRRNEEALAAVDQALALRPDFLEARGNRGMALAELYRPEEALADLDRALAALPDSGTFHGARAVALMRLTRYDEALVEARRGLALDPDTPQQRWNLSLLQLTMGDYAEGWANHEWRWRCEDLPPARHTDLPPWLGREDVAGKTVLIHAEQGLGDTLHFCRFAPLVTALGATVVLEVQKPLKNILQTLQGVAAVVAEGDPLPEVDFQCPMLSLPLALGTRVETIPAPIPYLAADPERVAAWAARLRASERPRVGLAVSGNAAYGNDRNRSMPMDFLAPLLDCPIRPVLVQKEIREGDRAFLAAHPQILVVADELRDFTDTAALMMNLDLIVSVDTSVAHLAGALGRPLWLMHPFVPEWRWLTGREDTPWYPQARMFRQPAMGDWTSLVARVAAEIRRRWP